MAMFFPLQGGALSVPHRELLAVSPAAVSVRLPGDPEGSGRQKTCVGAPPRVGSGPTIGRMSKPGARRRLTALCVLRYILDVVQALLAHPDPAARPRFAIGAVTTCVEPLASFTEHR